MLSLLHAAAMGLPTLMWFSEWLLLIIDSWYRPQCQCMLNSTALHNENAVNDTVPEDITVIQPTKVQEPMRCPDLAAQSADGAGIDLASR